MVEVYYYVPLKDVENAVSCGLKLSSWAERDVFIDYESRKCLRALLNPKDDLKKYKAEGFECLKIEIPSKYCFVAEGALYGMGVNEDEVMKMYEKTVIPIKEYRFGQYRLPECLITTTVIEGQIKVLDKRLDSPVLFDNSEELYVNNLIEENKEKYPFFNDVMLYYFYCDMVKKEKLHMVEREDENIVIFIDKNEGTKFVIKKPI